MKKNTGITCNSQVASQSPGTRASALPTARRPPSLENAAISQCPSTTTAMLATRRKST
jgi:hypothetical protein